MPIYHLTHTWAIMGMNIEILFAKDDDGGKRKSRLQTQREQHHKRFFSLFFRIIFFSSPATNTQDVICRMGGGVAYPRQRKTLLPGTNLLLQYPLSSQPGQSSSLPLLALGRRGMIFYTSHSQTFSSLSKLI